MTWLIRLAFFTMPLGQRLDILNVPFLHHKICVQLIESDLLVRCQTRFMLCPILKRESWEINRSKRASLSLQPTKVQVIFHFHLSKCRQVQKLIFYGEKKLSSLCRELIKKSFFMDFLMPWKIVKLRKLCLPCQTLNDRDNYFKNPKTGPFNARVLTKQLRSLTKYVKDTEKFVKKKINR